MAKFFIYILTICAVFLCSGLEGTSFGGDQPEDYQFYKKYGHTSKAWNDDVREGFAAYEAQDCDKVIEHLKHAVSLQAQDALVYFKLAVCTELKGSPYTAMQYYELAQEKLQGLKAVHRYQKEIFENYGRALFQAKKYKEALPYLTRAAAVGTPSFALYYMVGTLYAKNNDWNGAVDYFKKALSQDTTGVEPTLLSQVYYEVAKTYYEVKDLQQASQLLEKALALDPNNQKAIQLKNNVMTGLQQKSMVEMLKTLDPSQQPAQQTQVPHSAPPPPAASKLPPLQGSTQDPTPPMGTPVEGGQ